MVALAISTFLFGCDSKKPSPDAWEGRVETIDALNGLGIKFIENGEEFGGMREGSQLPKGSRIQTESGVVATLAVTGAAKVIVDGASDVELDRFHAKSIRLHHGRISLDSGNLGAVLLLGEREFELRPKTTIVAQAMQDASFVVLRGSASVGEQTIERGMVFAPGADPEISAGFDAASRTSWLQEAVDARAAPGFGEVTSVGDALEISIDEHSVDVEIRGGVAITTVIESFRSVGKKPGEAIFTFKAPKNALVTNVALYDKGKWVDSEVLPNQKADEVYRVAVSQGKAATLASTTEPGDVQLSLGVIKPEGQRKVRVTLQQPLEPQIRGQRYVYRMPRDAEGSLRVSSFNIRTRMVGSKPQDVTVFGYDMNILEQGDAATAAFTKQDFAPVGDLVIELKSAERAHALVNKSGYFALNARPKFSSPPKTSVGGVDQLIVLDNSESRAPKRDSDILMINAIIDSLEAEDRAMALVCSDECTPLVGGKFQPLTPDYRERLKSALFEVERSGATNIERVAQKVTEILKDHPKERSPRVLYATDAFPSAGALRPHSLKTALEALNPPPIHVILYGEHDPSIAAAVADASGGSVLNLTGVDAEAAVGRLEALAGFGLLANIQVEMPNTFEVFPVAQPPIAPGQAIIVTGKVSGELPKTLKLSGILAGEKVTFELPIRTYEDLQDVAPKFWASNAIKNLDHSNNADDSAKAARLAVENGLLSKHTRLVSIGSKEADVPDQGLSKELGELADRVTSHSKGGNLEQLGGLAAMGVTELDPAATKMALESIQNEYGGAPDLEEKKPRRGAGMRSKRLRPLTQPPKLTIEATNAANGLNAAMANRIFRQRRNAYLSCYEQRVQEIKTLAGDVVLGLQVLPNGRTGMVVIVDDTVGDEKLRSCLMRRAHQMKFPEDANGNQTDVQVLLRMRSQRTGRKLSLKPAVSWPVAQTPTAGKDIGIDRSYTVASETGAASKRAWTAYARLSRRDVETYGISTDPNQAPLILKDLADRHRLDPEAQEILIGFYAGKSDDKYSGRACAHARALADLKNEPLPKCPTSAPLLVPKPNAKFRLKATYYPTPQDARFYWLLESPSVGQEWLYSTRYRACRETVQVIGKRTRIEHVCEWESLPDGVYQVRLLKGDPMLKMVGEVSVVLDGKTTPFIDNGMFFNVGNSVVESPVITIPELQGGSVFGAAQVLRRLTRGARYCRSEQGTESEKKTATFQIGKDGSVRLKAWGVPAATRACLTSYVKQVQFPSGPASVATVKLDM